jgi:8-oxo-dGTP pyrophosphatase MutT (NUDIX family)
MEKAIELVKSNVGGFGIPDDNIREVLNHAFIGWYSRSIATALFVFCKNKKNQWCVLASERGEEAADFKGFWNCPCGYLDFDETTKDCARRECFEETGVDINSSLITFVSYEDDPVTANRQNVTFRFYAKVEDKLTEDFTFSKKNNEGLEVGRISWIPIEDIDNYKWAFGHKKRITEIFEQDIDPEGCYFQKLKIKKFFKSIGEVIKGILWAL